jgi:DNA gyrase/topoisomerase IV subunit B
MVKQGRVYVSLPPLYCWGKSAKDYGWCNKVEDIPAAAKDVHRFKGLGEMNDDQLYYFLVDKNTRNVLQIEYPSDIDEFNKIPGATLADKTERFLLDSQVKPETLDRIRKIIGKQKSEP